MIKIQQVENGYIVTVGYDEKHVFNALPAMYAWLTEYFAGKLEEERAKDAAPFHSLIPEREGER